MITLIRSGQSLGTSHYMLPNQSYQRSTTTPPTCRGMSIHILCRRMRDDITTPLKRTTVDWCSKCIVNNQVVHHAMSYSSKAFDVKHLTSWVRNRLTKETLCVFGWKALQSFHRPTLDQWRYIQYPTFSVLHQRDYTSRHIGDVRSHLNGRLLTNINDSIEVSSLTRRSQCSTNATFKGCNLLGYSIMVGLMPNEYRNNRYPPSQTNDAICSLVSYLKVLTLING